MIFFILTSCIQNYTNPTRVNRNDFYVRQLQYIQGFHKLKSMIDKIKLKNYKIIIVENNGKRQTYLDAFDCDVVYTNNNYVKTANKGIKELMDVREVIQKYNIDEDDFIVKMTGRYILDEDSPFMNALSEMETKNYESICKYGKFMDFVNIPSNDEDCNTGLIGLKCKYVKQIEMPKEMECVEWKWAKVVNSLNKENVCFLDKLGIYTCPLSNNYNCV